MSIEITKCLWSVSEEGDDNELQCGDERMPEPHYSNLLKHIGVSDPKDTLVIYTVATESSDQEEIWYPRDVSQDNITLDPDLCTETFAWGYVGTCNINIGGTLIPAFYIQNASPVGFSISNKYRELVESVPNYYG